LFEAVKADIPNGVAKAVFIQLVDRANGKNQCWPGMGRLAKDTGFHKATVIRAIKYLAENSYISIEHRFENGLKISNMYTLSTPIKIVVAESNHVVAESNHVVAESNHVVAESHQGSSREQLGVVAESNIEPPIKPPNEPNNIHSEFIAPSVEEVKTYCAVRGNTVNAELFVDHYLSLGWKVNGNQIYDWAALVRKWEITEKEKSNGSIRPGENSAGSGQRGAGNTNRTRDTTLTENLTDRSWAQRSGG